MKLDTYYSVHPIIININRFNKQYFFMPSNHIQTSLSLQVEYSIMKYVQTRRINLSNYAWLYLKKAIAIGSNDIILSNYHDTEELTRNCLLILNKAKEIANYNALKKITSPISRKLPRRYHGRPHLSRRTRFIIEIKHFELAKTHFGLCPGFWPFC